MKYEKCCRNCEYDHLSSCKGCVTFGENTYENFILRDELAKIENETLIELPCKVGDTIYSLIDKEIFECKVSMVFQKSDKTWHFRFSYLKFVTRNPWVENPKYEWVTYQSECVKGDFGEKVFTDKATAEASLKESLEQKK